MTRARDVERILAAFEGPDPQRGDRPAGLASVLLALFDSVEGPALLFIRRADSLRSHPGEISFPGGRVDPTDEGPMGAALREAHEEVGLDPARVTRVGHLVDFMTHHGSIVCAYVGRVEGEPPPREAASPEEVSDVFLVPIERLMDPDAYEARRIDGMPADRRVHYWHVPPRIIWGITGELTAKFLERACGWSPPVDARTVMSMSEFMPAFNG